MLLLDSGSGRSAIATLGKLVCLSLNILIQMQGKTAVSLAETGKAIN